MTRAARRTGPSAALAALLLAPLLASSPAFAHCDTLDGPVVAEARVALVKGDVTPVLKWVRAGDEAEIRAAFAQVLVVRATGDAARQLADRYFFETLVRVHRAGEGAPYTGLLPEGSPVEPAVALADRALAAGDAGKLTEALAGHVEEGTRLRFTRAAEAKRHAEESVPHGRAYVAAYVELTHWVERLHRDATTDAVHGGEKAAAHAH